MTNVAKFIGCKHLDFEPNYDAIRQATTKGLFWMRAERPSMVQFCKKRGRLYGCMACIGGKHNSQCSDYEEIRHEVDVPKSELDSDI